MKSRYFRIEELVDKATYSARGDRAWELLNPNLILFIDLIKEKFPEGTITINNWLWGGDRQWSGLRTPNSPWYSTYSQHSFGNAVDMLLSAYPSEEVRKYIHSNLHEFPMLKGLEKDVTWVHADVRNRIDLLEFSA